MKDAIGYTNDGNVFFVVDIRAPNREPLTATLTWTPKNALRIAGEIEKAALQVQAKAAGIVLADNIEGIR